MKFDGQKDDYLIPSSIFDFGQKCMTGVYGYQLGGVIKTLGYHFSDDFNYKLEKKSYEVNNTGIAVIIVVAVIIFLIFSGVCFHLCCSSNEKNKI